MSLPKVVPDGLSVSSINRDIFSLGKRAQTYARVIDQIIPTLSFVMEVEFSLRAMDAALNQRNENTSKREYPPPSPGRNLSELL